MWYTQYPIKRLYKILDVVQIYALVTMKEIPPWHLIM